jgi:hypothetical protein
LVTGEHACVFIDGNVVASESWEMERFFKPAEATNCKDGRLRLKTLPDAKGSFSVFYDLSAPIDTYIEQGKSVVLDLYLDSTQDLKYTVDQALVTSVSVKNSGFEDMIKADVEWILSGIITPPTATP